MDEDVRKLLITWNLEEYMEIFEKNKISVDCLNLLDDSMIRELFPTIGDRAIFQKNFQNWKSIALGQFSVMNMDVDILQEKHRNPLTEMTNIELFQTLMNTEDAPENANSDTPNPVSPLKVMENKQEGIQQSKDNKLLDLLQSSAEGKIILSLHKDDGLLSSSSRRRICNIIIKHLLGDDPSKTNIPSSVLFDMASQIKEVFNKENISTYFIPYINNKKLKIRRCAKGKLYDCLQNRKGSIVLPREKCHIQVLQDLLPLKLMKRLNQRTFRTMWLGLKRQLSRGNYSNKNGKLLQNIDLKKQKT
ncbi:uncharacterized protein LOC133521620 [Cydia pomonella]|uniref:uncharacterized protein LOC133521620 n=1 Tax=Cydia pomonella TaxID=82600 RepID=UPI002ADD73C4|nr:uncharacterized protein LOC133521620 [Cydia pomonella]